MNLFKKNIKIHLRLILLLISIIIFIPTFSQVNADFTTSDDTTGCSNLFVKFTNLSTGNGTLTYQWDFEGAGTDTAANPEILFSSPGTYTVTLIVTNGTESDTLVKENYIQYYNKPTADFISTSDLLGCSPLQVSFQDQSTTGDTTITSWLWSFDDGNTSTEQNPDNTYLTAGDYSVSLQVFDANGCDDFKTINDFVSVKNPPVANFSVDQTATCLESFDVPFNNFSSGYGLLQFEWDFGDGTTSTETDPTHTYTGANLYDVQLIVVDENDCSDTLLKNDYIEIAEIVAGFELATDTICPAVNIPITNTSTGASSFVWNFGDGTVLLDETPEHEYSDSGKYVITLDVYSGAECHSSFTDTIYVEYVVADFEFTPNYSCKVPFTVNYTNQSINAVSYVWHFGNGNISSEENPENIIDMSPELELYNRAYYTDTLYATTNSGCTSRFIAQDKIEVILPQAKFVPNNDDCCFPDSLNGCSPLIVTFKDTSEFDSPNENIASFHWDFGDGDTADQSTVTHSFTQPGEFTIKYVITTETGCTDTATAIAKVGSSPVANFTMTGPAQTCASNSVQFNDLSTVVGGEVNGWQWYFSDGLTSTEPNPQHAFLDTGYMSVKLVAVYNGCESPEFNVDSIVKILGPVSTFSETVDCESPTDFTFDGNIQGAEKYYWNFGDNSPIDSIHEDPNHIYAITNDYTVSLQAINNTTGCDYYMEKSIGVRDIKASFVQDAQIGCAGLNVAFDANESSDFFTYDIQGIAGSFFWDFGDGTQNLFTKDTIVSHSFNKRGKYIVSLIVKDVNGCYDTLKSFVKTYKPVAGFTADPSIGCMPLTVNFTDTTLSDTIIVNRSWYFGDNVFGTQPNETHIYSEIGTYSVYLEIEDILGCADTLTIDGLITATRPIPGFSVSDQTICAGDSILFTNEAESSYDSLIWNFGDNQISNQENPFHIYADSGYYNVSLQLFDILGCDSVLEKQSYIHVQSIPDVNFSASLTEASCYPVLIHFNDLTTHPYKSSWKWSFGSGQGTSILENPSYNYTQPGQFSIDLKVETSYGCTDSLLKENYININGPVANISAPDSACPRIPIQFMVANPVNVSETRWNFGDGIQNPGDTALYSFTNYGMYSNYILYVLDTGDCQVQIKDSIYIYSFAPGFILNDSSGCIPFTLEITDTAIGISEYLWEFGDGNMASNQNPNYTYNQAGTFLLQQIVLNNFDCIDTSSVEIEVYQLPDIRIANPDTLICVDDAIQITSTGGETYQWSPVYEINNSTISNPLVSPKYDTLYNVLGTDVNGCSERDSIFIKVQQRPVIDSITADTSVIIGETVQLNASFTNGKEFYWLPDMNISSTDSLNPTALIEDDIIYIFTVIDSNECFEITDDVNISVLKKYSIDLPTAFTPDGDINNNKIFVNGWGILKLIEFNVYDRLGQLIFTTDDINTGWNGTYQGKPQPIGTYVYTVIIKSYDGEQRSKTGSFRLLR
ncbi:MAG: PKD domain-containing protein [Chlorobi bacterium]|nr:PKD domain-containing protein [Chlorobiota bacterium]